MSDILGSWLAYLGILLSVSGKFLEQENREFRSSFSTHPFHMTTIFHPPLPCLQHIELPVDKAVRPRGLPPAPSASMYGSFPSLVPSVSLQFYSQTPRNWIPRKDHLYGPHFPDNFWFQILCPPIPRNKDKIVPRSFCDRFYPSFLLSCWAQTLLQNPPRHCSMGYHYQLNRVDMRSNVFVLPIINHDSV